MIKFLGFRLRKHFLAVCLVAWLISGCSVAAVSNLPTQLPTDYVPTAIALTVAASSQNQPVVQPEQATPEPTLSPSPSPMPPTAPPTATEQAIVTDAPSSPETTAVDQQVSGRLNPPAGLPNCPIQILSPGPASRVTSPFLMRAVVQVGQNGIVRLELLGEDGRLLMREVQQYGAAAGKSMALGIEVEYEIAAAGEAGRLQIGIEDAEGRQMAQSSTDLILLSMGEADLTSPADQLEDIFIEAPRANALIQGGVVRISGLARPRSSRPLMIELQTGDGRIVGTRQAVVETIPGSTHGSFMVDLPYSVESPTRVRLVIWEPGERIPGIVHLSSVEVMLSP